MRLFSVDKWLSFSAIIFLFAGCVTTPETGRSALILTSESEETKLGIQAYSEVLQKEKISNNPRWNEVLQRVGGQIASAANKPDFKWEFKLIESDEKNAFCLPGGKVAVYTGILSVCQNEAGLATVLGHEVAHATARHAGQRITLAMGTNFGLAALGALIGAKDGSSQKNILLAALGLGAQVGAVLPFSRANESEADKIGLIYMSRAGYDPREAAQFWSRFAKAGGKGAPTFLSTHPNSEDRAQAMREDLPKALEIYEGSAKHGTGQSLVGE